MPSSPQPQPQPLADPTDIENTPPSLRNPDLAPGVRSAQQGHLVSGTPTAALTNNYASNGHWDRDDLGPVSYVPPVEADVTEGRRTEAGSAPGPSRNKGPQPGSGTDTP